MNIYLSIDVYLFIHIYMYNMCVCTHVYYSTTKQALMSFKRSNRSNHHLRSSIEHRGLVSVLADL